MEVDLNIPDRSNGETVLDYVERELAQHRGTNLEPVETNYQRLLTTHGAKRAAEL